MRIETVSLERLEEVRTVLGPIVHLDLSRHPVEHAHRLLGEQVASKVGEFVRRRVIPLGSDHLRRELAHARGCRGDCLRRLDSRRLPAPIQRALGTYLDCVRAWTDGAGLASLVQELDVVPADGPVFDALDLAFLLQMEGAGCQTGMLRDREGAVLLWHTEEDHESPAGSRFDHLRLVTFAAAPESPSSTMTGFVYPDLLPGPAFGWSGSSYAHAVDAFYLQPGDPPVGVPANAVTWICLALGGAISPSDVCASLAPIQSGYALSSVTCRGDVVDAEITEFVGELSRPVKLGIAPGAWSHMVNMLSHHVASETPGRENLVPEMRRELEARQARAARAVRAITARTGDWHVSLQRLLASRVGGGFAAANPSVKATFLCRMSPVGTRYRVDPGPALRRSTASDGSWLLET